MRWAWLVFVAACGGDVDPPWQLDHERVVAVRATPPHVPSGATSQLDALVAHKGAMTEVVAPEAITVVSPMALADTAISGATITAPDEAHLAAARAELGLAAGAPVPLELGAAPGGDPRWGRAHRDDPIVIELPRLVGVAAAAGEHDRGHQRRALHSTPRRPSDGTSGSDRNAVRCE